ncbi:MAG: C39 family peptidase [Candidatus Doudnabacteria bacterium]
MIISAKKTIFLVLTLSIIVAGFILYWSRVEVEFSEVQKSAQHNSDLPSTPETVEVKEQKDTSSLSQDSLPLAPAKIPREEEKIPSEFLLDVPFASQSPYAKWDERDEESCEEASIVMVHYFRQKKVLTKELMRRELDALIEFQIKHYGDYKDSDAEDIAKLAEECYHYKEVRVSYDISISGLKREIAAGNPVIVPAAGRLLYNPYFTPPGPLYHNLVLIGFNEKGFITNDPGTRRGEHYFYPYDVLYNAIHDFPGTKEQIEQGRKAVVVIQ